MYDKPMIYYPLSVLMLAGIREILIISTPADLPQFKQFFGTASSRAGDFLRGATAAERAGGGVPDWGGVSRTGISCLVLGDNLFYGHDFSPTLKAARCARMGRRFSVTMWLSRKLMAWWSSTQRESRCRWRRSRPCRVELCGAGLYFYDEQVVEMARSLKPSPRGELEITDLNRLYMEAGKLHVEILGRGFAWLDTGTHDSLQEAADFVRGIQHRQGLKIACLEEIAFMQEWITPDQLQELITHLGKTSYADYLKQLAKEWLATSKTETDRERADCPTAKAVTGQLAIQGAPYKFHG